LFLRSGAFYQLIIRCAGDFWGNFRQFEEMHFAALAVLLQYASFRSPAAGKTGFNGERSEQHFPHFGFIESSGVGLR
jgi:hypothetical protein